MNTHTSKTLEFQDTLISAVADVEGYGYLLETQDPWGNAHHWRESDDLYPTEEDAIAAGRDYVDNYDPTPEEPPYAEDESYTDSLYRIMKMK